MAEAGATAEDVAHRKQRLLEGPEEFRDSRSDQHYAKPFARIPAERRLADAAEGMAAYREREAAAYTNLQRLRDERLSRERETVPATETTPGGKKRKNTP
jgi:hypothetical protein